ncbi:unnamed protein product, partial [Durusdinium trenchii]
HFGQACPMVHEGVTEAALQDDGRSQLQALQVKSPGACQRRGIGRRSWSWA